MDLVINADRNLRLIRATLAGLFLSLSFAQNWWLLAVVAVSWLYRLLTWRNFKQRLVSINVFGLAFFGSHLWWMKVLGVDAWLLISLLCIFSFMVIALVPVRRSSRRSKFEFAAAWLLAELIRGSIPWGGFNWGFIAYPSAGSSLANLGRIGGGALVTVVLILIATSLAEFFQGRTVRRTALILGTVFIASLVNSGASTQSIRIGIVQGGEVAATVPEHQRPDAVLKQQIDLTNSNKQVLSGSDLIIWPENSVNLFSTKDSNSTQIQQVVDLVGKPFLIGAVLDPVGSPPKNVAILWLPQSGANQIYVKQHLVPFGEYLPMRNLLASKIGRFDQIPIDFESGTDGGLIQLNGIGLGVAICFEVADQHHMSDVSLDGSEVLIAISNNSTYLGTSQPEQQFQISRYSASIHNRAMAVVTTTGVSGVINPDGKQILKTQTSNAQVLVADVPRVAAVTFADRHHRALQQLQILLIALLTISSLRRQWQSRESSIKMQTGKVGK